MSQKVAAPTNKPSFEQTYFALTEHLVRYYGLSLNYLANPAQAPKRHLPTPTYQPADLLTPEQAGAVLGLSPQTLANWRTDGRKDLSYRKIGRAIRYQHADLLAFAESRRRNNTSQH